MADESFSVRLHVDGARELLRALKRMPSDANNEIRDAAGELADEFVALARSAAQGDDAPQTRLLIATIRRRRDRVPALAVGGARRVGSRRRPAYKVLFGSEFGSNRYRQFARPHAGRAGYWFFPLVESEGPRIGRAWLAAADNVVDRFERR